MAAKSIPSADRRTTPLPPQPVRLEGLIDRLLADCRDPLIAAWLRRLQSGERAEGGGR